MENLSSEDDSDHRTDQFDSYADVSEPESCDSFPLYESLLSSADRQFNSKLDFPASASIMFDGRNGGVISVQKKPEKFVGNELSTDVELIKERFAKLLLGEDLSGRGKGVSTALAISNAITNLSATVFGDLWKLEALTPERKSMWTREIEWLLSVSDSIVELIPSLQELPDGGTFEVMVTRPRSDLYVNLPALKTLDEMLISMLDGFCESEFYYVDRGVIIAGGVHIEGNTQSPPTGRPIMLQEKWWLPFPKVPPRGLDEVMVNRLLKCRECTNQIFKAAMAINSTVLSEMEIPNIYLENLPKSAKACLGETLYRYIAAVEFSFERLFDYLETSSEYTTLEIANRIEAAVHIWSQKYNKSNVNQVKAGRSSWGGTVKGLVGDREKSKLYKQRAETLLRKLKVQFSGLPQTALDMKKIQYNKDVGQSILESYSRALESLAFNLMARIDDLLYVDDATKQQRAEETISMLTHRDSTTLPLQKMISHRPLSSPLSPILSVPECCSSSSNNGNPNRRPPSYFHTSSHRHRPLNENLERLSF